MILVVRVVRRLQAWQFIPSTGRIYGLNKQYDGRRDVIESTRAAMTS